MIVGLAFHILAAVIWVGGMFFAYVVLRPSSGPLEPPLRLALWDRVLSRFFMWVWLCVAALLASGFAMALLGLGGFAVVGAHVHIMTVVGIIMTLIFAYLYAAPWRRFHAAIADADWPSAARHLARIRMLVGTNLMLGLATVAIGASGRYW